MGGATGTPRSCHKATELIMGWLGIRPEDGPGRRLAAKRARSRISSPQPRVRDGRPSRLAGPEGACAPVAPEAQRFASERAAAAPATAAPAAGLDAAATPG